MIGISHCKKPLKYYGYNGKNRITEAARLIADTIVGMLQFSETIGVDSPDNKPRIEQANDNYQRNLGHRELTLRSEVETLFNYRELESDETELALVNEEPLFREHLECLRIK